MEIKTSELTGSALDWAVAQSCNTAVDIIPSPFDGSYWPVLRETMKCYRPSEDWGQIGPLIETCKVGMVNATTKQPWLAMCESAKWCEGDTPLIAACRAIVYAKLGDTVTVPDELEAQ